MTTSILLPRRHSELRRRARRTRYELSHLIRVRLWLLRAELAGRGIACSFAGGDGVAVLHDGLWFDVYPWQRAGRRFTWVVDHPHTDLADEQAGWEIGRRNGFRFDVTELAGMWADFIGDRVDEDLP